MGILIDSDFLIEIERKQKDISNQIRGRESEDVFLSVITASELLHGVYRAKEEKIKAKRLAFVEAVLCRFPIIEIDLSIARSHALLWSSLCEQGSIIGLHDSWIAATCLAYDLTLITGNLREFKRVAGLKIEKWV